MSGDRNMNQTDSAWRKRQIALDKKAENARELGLDYEPSKTIQEMAYEAGLLPCEGIHPKDLEAFAKLVREDEREACAKVCEEGIANADDWNSAHWDQACENRAWAIRERSST